MRGAGLTLAVGMLLTMTAMVAEPDRTRPPISNADGAVCFALPMGGDAK